MCQRIPCASRLHGSVFVKGDAAHALLTHQACKYGQAGMRCPQAPCLCLACASQVEHTRRLQDDLLPGGHAAIIEHIAWGLHCRGVTCMMRCTIPQNLHGGTKADSWLLRSLLVCMSCTHIRWVPSANPVHADTCAGNQSYALGRSQSLHTDTPACRRSHAAHSCASSGCWHTPVCI